MAIITDRTISTRPNGKDQWFVEKSAKGQGQFCARITMAGSRLFYFRYTGPDGRQVRLPIGVYDSTGKKGLTLKDARVKAGELSLLYQGGTIDLRAYLEAERRLAKAQQAAEEARLDAEKRAAEIEASRLTVEALFEKWEQLHLINHKDGGAEIRRMFELDVLPVIGALPAHLIRKGSVMEIVDSITERGAKRVAKRVFASLRQMFRFAVERDLVDGDPTVSIRKATVGGKDVERDRVLSDDEIRTLAKKLPTSGLSSTATAAVWIALATGCRIGELLKARWEHVDLENRCWLVPAENAKNGLPLEVYLSEFTLAQFKALEQFKCGDWLYPARWRDKETGEPRDTHVSLKTVTRQIGDRQRIEAAKKRSASTGTLSLQGGKWTMHDLRRTASTVMGNLGIKPEVIDRCQNHKEPNRVRRIYQRYSYQSEMRLAWTLLGARLESLKNEKDTARLIPLKKRA